MVLHVRRMPEHSEGNHDFRGGSVGNLFEGRIVGCAPKVSQYLTSN